MDSHGSGAYSKIFNVALVVVFVMVGLTVFLGYYIPSVGASADVPEGDFALDKGSVKCPMAILSDNNWYPENKGTVRVGGVTFDFLPQPDHINDKMILLAQEILSDGAHSSVYEVPLSESTDYTYIFHSDNVKLSTRDFYFNMSNIYFENETRWDVWAYNGSTGEYENKSLGSVEISVYWGGNPEYVSGIGFREVVFGLFSFDVPLVPDIFAMFISTVFMLCLSFVVFAVIIKTAPFVG